MAANDLSHRESMACQMLIAEIQRDLLSVHGILVSAEGLYDNPHYDIRQTLMHMLAQAEEVYAKVNALPVRPHGS